MVCETDVEIQPPVFKRVFYPVLNFSSQAWIPATEIESVRVRRDRGVLSAFSCSVLHAMKLEKRMSSRPGRTPA
jgi:hypothetical protein